MKSKSLVLLLVFVVAISFLISSTEDGRQKLLVGVDTGKVICAGKVTYFDKNRVESEVKNVKVGDTLMIEVVEPYTRNLKNEMEYNLYPKDVNDLDGIACGRYLNPERINHLEYVVVTAADKYNAQLKLSGETKELF